MNKNPFAGPWRIVWMSGWDQDYVEMAVPGHITFETARFGSFQFGLVQGQMDYRIDRPQGQRIEFIWRGFDEGDELTGRGHAEIVDGELHGHLFIYLGEDSAFRAVRQAMAPKRTRKRKEGKPASTQKGMSEYQYYEFAAIERPLTRAEMAELHAVTADKDDELARLRAENARLVGLLEAHGVAWRMPAPAPGN